MGSWKEGKAHGLGTIQSDRGDNVLNRHGFWENGK